MKRTFITRTLSGAVLLILTIASHILGGPVLFALTALISLIGMCELYKLVGMNKNILGLVGYATAIAYYGTIYLKLEQYSMMSLVFGLMIIFGVYVFTYPRYKSSEVMHVFFGIVYVAVMLSYIYQVRSLQSGVYLVWLIYICAWGNDTCAYLAGITLGRNGKHKMSPNLSPKKSVEGFFGGIIGAALIGVIYAAFVGEKVSQISNPMIVFAVVGACGALLSVVGDLTASAIKRNHEIKDYGKLIPGHGGILDRYDSVIFTAPAVFYLVELINKIM